METSKAAHTSQWGGPGPGLQESDDETDTSLKIPGWWESVYTHVEEELGGASLAWLVSAVLRPGPLAPCECQEWRHLCPTSGLIDNSA